MLSSLKDLLFNNDYFNPPSNLWIRPIGPDPEATTNYTTEFLRKLIRSDEVDAKRYMVKLTFITLVAIDVLSLLFISKKIMNTGIELSCPIFGLAAIGALSKKYLFCRNAPNREQFDRLSSIAIPALVTATLTQTIAKAAISYYQ